MVQKVKNMSRKKPKTEKELEKMHDIFNNEDLHNMKLKAIRSYGFSFGQYTTEDLVNELYSNVDVYLLAYYANEDPSKKAKITTYAYSSYLNYLQKLRQKSFDHNNLFINVAPITEEDEEVFLDFEDNTLDEDFVKSYVVENFDELKERALKENNKMALMILLNIYNSKD